MGIFRSKYIHSAVLLCVALTTINCSRKNDENKDFGKIKAEGGQDSGGGSVFESSPEQVNAALDRAISLANEPDQRLNIFVQFWMDWGRTNKREFIRKPVRLFPKVTEPLSGPAASQMLNEPGKFESPLLDAIKRNKLNRLPSGNCPNSKIKKHTDGSVSSFDINAEICFSIGNLTRIPPSTLLREVLSLVLHEAIHLGGGEEDEAVAWQEEFSAYFGARFGDLTTNTVSTRTLKSLAESKIFITRAIEYAKTNVKNPRIFGSVGRAAQELASLPDFLDAMALELKIKPAHPELINNYSNSVLAILQKIKVRFDFQPALLSIKIGPSVPINMLPVDQVVPTLVDLSAHLDQINENFLAFVGGDTAAQSVCILPVGEIDVNAIGNNQLGNTNAVKVFVPSRECSKQN